MLKALLSQCWVLGFSFAVCGIAAQDLDEMDALRREVQALRAEVDQLRRARAGARAADRSDGLPADDVLESATRRALDDASGRTSFLTDAPVAGHDGRFFLADAEGRYRVNLGGLLQFRYTANFRDDPTGGDADQAGFTVHRARVKLDGYLGDPRLRFFAQFNTDRSTGNAGLLDAWVDLDLTDSGDAGAWTMRVGRFKVPLLREQLTAASSPLAVERSLVHGTFTAGRTEGLALYHTAQNVRLSLSLNDGVRASGTDFNDDRAEIAGTARADWKVFGDWDQFGDFAGFTDDTPSLFLGAAVHGELGEDGNDIVNNDFLIWTVDGSIEDGPLNAFASVVGRQDHPDAGGTAESYGYLVQLGYMAVPDRLQPFLRYEHLDLNGGAGDVDLLTAGVNYFFRGQSVRASLDAVWVLDPLASGSGALGLLPAADDDQMVLRAQLQVTF